MIQMDPGGTANLAVLGGNLPPSFGTTSMRTKGASPALPERRASRPPQQAGGLFRPELYCIVPVQSA